MDRAMATEYRRVLMGLVSMVIDWYGRDGQCVPSVYDSKVVYRRRHDEVFRPPWVALAEGDADAAELVVWRVAELRSMFRSGRERATIRVEWGSSFCLVLVRRADGTIEDPVVVLRERAAL